MAKASIQEKSSEQTELPPVVSGDKNSVVTVHNICIARRVLRKLFNELEFRTKEERIIQRDSYMLNVVDLILYAKENGMSPYTYIQSLKTELLKDPNVHAR